MKLAQALAQRADIQQRIEQLHLRLRLNARVQDGETPAEDPKKLMSELDSLFIELEKLIAAINRTNSASGDGEHTITELLARRDCLAKKTGIMRSFLDSASEVTMRGTKTEIVIKSTVPVAKLREKTDDMSRELRELDDRIQELNWTVELI